MLIVKERMYEFQSSNSMFFYFQKVKTAIIVACRHYLNGWVNPIFSTLQVNKRFQIACLR